MTICIAKKKYTAKEIAADIEAYIIDTSQKSNTPLATPRWLAKKYNVSSMTINRAITTLVEKGVVYRVQGKGTFVAKQRVLNRDKLVGYFAWQHTSTPWDEAAYGTFEDILISGLDELGVKVDFILRSGYRSKIISFAEAIKYDLLIIPSGMVTPQTLPWLKRLAVPIIVAGDSQILPYPFHQVFHYYDLGFETALSYLKKQGEHNIFIAGIQRETSQKRVEILRKVANDMKVAHETLPLGIGISGDTSLALLCGREQGKYFLDNNLNGVIFALSDFIALGIIDVVKERNLELGKDVKIISYDNLESRAPFSSDNAVITSITHPLIELARETVKLADDIIENDIKDSGITKIVKVPACEFVIRKSFY
jgi:DNA-binding LacI/PurR family transcriptional regulator